MTLHLLGAGVRDMTERYRRVSGGRDGKGGDGTYGCQ